jgi:hypothetical protein
MGVECAFLDVGDLDEDFGAAWDALPAGRSAQADIFDSWAWHAAALDADPGLARAMRVAAVMAGGEPKALLPLTRTRTGTWRNIGIGTRARRRVVVGTEEPEPDLLDMLVDTVARKAGRLELLRLPSRDPASHELIQALRRAGYCVEVREENTDRLAPVVGGWAGHSKTYKSFAQYSKRFSGRVSGMWDLTMDTYGTSPAAPVVEGFRLYADLQARSWKGPFDPTTYRRRLVLLTRAERLGWARVFVLRIAGKPVAGHVWFRVGDVATWMSTSHDTALNSLSPGTIVQWWSQERIVTDPIGAPAVLDFLPGGSPQKDRLSPERPALLEIDAVRRVVAPGAALTLQRAARRVAPAGKARVDAMASRLRGLTEKRGTGEVAVRRLTVASGEHAPSVQRLDLDDAVVRRYLAVAAGQASVEAATRTWSPGDGWWQIGSEPAALARVGQSPEHIVREVVRLDADIEVETVARALATAFASQVVVLVSDGSGAETGEPVVTRDPLLPWPAPSPIQVPTGGHRS